MEPKSTLQRSIGLAMRASAVPALLGMRWLSRQGSAVSLPGIPTAARDLSMFGKVALDELFLASEFVASAMVSVRDHRRCIQEVRDAIDLYDARGWLDEPASYHQRPPAMRDARIETGGFAWLDYAHLSFESGYEPHPEEPGRERWLGYEANRTAHTWVLRHPGRARPWLVCVPAYRMGHPVVDFTGFRARWLHEKLGLNVAILVMPLHGPRRAGRRSGDGFLSGDFVDTVHAQAQAVWDVRRIVAWLQDEGAPAVGIYGMSLGGYTTALVAALEEELDCVVAGIPATNFVHLARDHAPRPLLQLADWAGFSLDRIDQMMRVVSPLALEPRVAHDRLYLYAGVGDRLASTEQAGALWEHWGRPRALWYQGSHVSFLWEREVRRLLREAFRRAGMVPGAEQQGAGPARRQRGAA